MICLIVMIGVNNTKGPVPIEDATTLAQGEVRGDPRARQTTGSLVEVLGDTYGIFHPLRIYGDTLPYLTIPILQSRIYLLEFEQGYRRFKQNVLSPQNRAHATEYGAGVQDGR
jgi:hypothetical protein